MPRRLPRYDLKLGKEIASALSLVAGLERARVLSIQGHAQLITLTHLELSYELAFLRVYLAWESLLEDALLRLLCGYRHSGGPEPLLHGKIYYPNLADAETAILGGRNYRLWHTPSEVIGRARSLLVGSRYEIVIASAGTRLGRFAAVRHRIAHSQKHAQQQFDQATMALTGRRYPGSRAGRFLRDWTPSITPPIRWLNTMFHELSGLSHQICG